MKRGLWWKIPAAVLLTGLAEWGLLAYPGTRLVGLVVLSVLLGVFLTFSLQVFAVGIVLGPLIERWGVRGFLLAAACLSVGILAMIGSIERAQAGYVWAYGAPARIAVPADTSCTWSGYECAGSWTSGGTTVRGAVTMSKADFDNLHGPLLGEGDAYHLGGHALGDRAVSGGLHLRPASSVALGMVPAWIGWGAGGAGLAAVLFAVVAPRKRSRT